MAEALTLAWAKGPRLFVAAALEELGVHAVRQGQGALGVQHLAAAAALRTSMCAPVRSIDQPAIDHALSAARAALGASACAEAWTAGETQPLEQMVALAQAVAGSVVVAPEGAGDS
jgi:hypothetical protein